MAQRDTQFQGFASLVLNEMLHASDGHTYSGLIDGGSEAWREAMQHIIARRSHDLVNHAMSKLEPYDYETNANEDLVYLVPDLEELPKEEGTRD